MNLYVIRRPSGWRTPEELQAAAARSKQVGDDEMSADIRWIRSYVVHEADGGLGTVCIYQASSPEKIREHAARVGMPATEIVEVADTGPGIANADMDRIFEPFYRVRSDASAPSGSGLGLAIAASLAHASGGRLAVDSRIGQGSTFRLSLPRFR